MTDDVLILDAGADAAADTVEVVAAESARPFLTTPLNDYTVTEGLLLCILLFLVLGKIAKIIKEGFYWLL